MRRVLCLATLAGILAMSLGCDDKKTTAPIGDKPSGNPKGPPAAPPPPPPPPPR